MLESAVISGPVVQGRRLPLHATLAGRLKKARQAAGLSARKLSLVAGLSDNACLNIEQGRVPGIDTVEKIAGALELSPCCLAFGVEGPPLLSLADDALRAAGCGARVAQLREHQGLSKLALAAAAGLGGSAILPIESGRVVPSVATVEALAVALGCSPCWLAFGEGADPMQDPTRAAAEASAVKYRPPRKPPAPRRRTARKTRK